MTIAAANMLICGLVIGFWLSALIFGVFSLENVQELHEEIDRLKSELEMEKRKNEKHSDLSAYRL